MHPAPVETSAAVELHVQLPAGVLTATGLNLTDPNLPREDAESIGYVIGAMHKSLQFAIGDWLIFIEAVYPEEWSQMSEILGVSEEKRREYRRVSARVPKSVRRANVDWSHHRAVAALTAVDARTGEVLIDHKAQKQWLKKVEDERMSHHALRDALRNGKPDAVQTHCRCCGRLL